MGCRRQWILPVVALGLAAAMLGGCRGSRLGESELAGGGEAAAQPGSAYQSIGTALPPPSALQPLLGSGRQVSYSEEHYICHGQEYSTSLPHRNVSVSSDSARFDTDWSVATGMTPENLGFCCYTFVALSSYARETEVRYGWHDAPEDVGTAWLALADWDRNCWVWHQCTASGVFAVPTFDPYISPTDELVAVMVMANAETSTLRWIRLGPPLVSAEVIASPAEGLVPMEITLDASASTTGVGTVDKYEWDLDEDGEFEQITFAISTVDVLVSASGPHEYTVRASNSYGVPDTASVNFAGSAPWAHSWGGDAGDEIAGVAVADSEFIYAVGQTNSFGIGMTDALILKCDLEGNLIWARAWGFEKTDTFSDIDVDGNGDLIVVGESYTFGPAGTDALIQKWDAGGNLLWSYVCGGDEFDKAAAVAVRSDAIYVAGDTESFGAGGKDVLLLKLDLDGVLVWPRVWGGIDGEYACDITTWKYFMGGVSAYISGATYTYGAGERDVLYLRYLEDGTLATQRCWGGAEWEVGESICVTGILTADVYIGGHTGGYVDRDVLLLEVGSGTGLLARTCGGLTIDEAYGIQRAGGSLVLGGGTRSFSSSKDGLLVSFDLDGTLGSAAFWGTPDHQEWFNCMYPFPGSGILLGGEALAAQGGAWSPATATVADATGSWLELSTLPTTPAADLTSRPGTVTDITTAIVDTGGGLADALVVAAQTQ